MTLLSTPQPLTWVSAQEEEGEMESKLLDNCKTFEVTPGRVVNVGKWMGFSTLIVKFLIIKVSEFFIWNFGYFPNSRFIFKLNHILWFECGSTSTFLTCTLRFQWHHVVEIVYGSTSNCLVMTTKYWAGPKLDILISISIKVIG